MLRAFCFRGDSFVSLIVKQKSADIAFELCFRLLSLHKNGKPVHPTVFKKHNEIEIQIEIAKKLEITHPTRISAAAS